MGNSQSNTSKTSIYNDIKVSIEVCVSNNISNNTSCDAANDQSNDVVFGNCADINCSGNVNISQTSKAAMKCISTNTTGISVEITNDIATIIENVIKKAMENATEGVPSGTDQDNTDLSDIHNEIEMNIKTDITNNITNIFTSMMTTEQDNSLTFNGKISGENCDLSLNNFIEQVAESVNETVINIITSNTVINDILNKYDLTMKNDLKGFDFNKFFSDFFDVFNGIVDAISENLPFGGLKSLLEKFLPIAIVIGVVVAAIALFGVIGSMVGGKKPQAVDTEF